MYNETISYFQNYHVESIGNFMVGSNNTGILFEFDMTGPWETKKDDNKLRYYLMEGIFPSTLSIYRKELLGYFQERNLAEDQYYYCHFPHFQKIHLFLSHAHESCEVILPYLNSNVNVYMSDETYLFYREVTNDFNKVVANIVPLEADKWVDLEDIGIKLIDIKSGIPGSAGLLIEAGGCRVLYPGDLQRNGIRPEELDSFIEKYKREDIDLVVSKGKYDVRHNDCQNQVGQPLYQLYQRELSKAEGLVYLFINRRKLRDIAQLVKVSKGEGRKLVLNYDIAKLFNNMICHGYRPFGDEKAEDYLDDILVLNNDKITWADTKIYPYKEISVAEIIKNKSDYVLYLDPYNDNLMCELENPGGYYDKSVYLLFHDKYQVDSNYRYFEDDKRFKIDRKYYRTGYCLDKELLKNMAIGIGPATYITSCMNSLNLEGIREFRFRCMGTKSLRELVEGVGYYE